MSTKHKNPYREGSDYHLIFGLVMKKQIVTRSWLIEAGKKINKTLAAAKATAGVILSPRKTHAGNDAAHGEAYFFVALKHKVGEEKRFRLFWRKAGEMERSHTRKATSIAKAAKKVKAVRQQKTAKVNKAPAKVDKVEKVEAPAPATVEAPATA